MAGSETEFYPGISTSDFAITTVAMPFTYATPAWGQTTACTLQRVGDFVMDLCLEIQVAKGDTSHQALPQGSYYPAEALIDSMSISIGGIEVEKLTKDWFRVYDATLRPIDKADAYQAATNFDSTTICSSAPSTETLLLTIPFWFTRNTAQALPIVALNDVPRISLTTTNDPASLGLDASQQPSLRMYVSYGILTQEANAQMSKELQYDIDVVQLKNFTVRNPNTSKRAPFTVDLTLTGWVRAIFWVFKSTLEGVGHARYVGGQGLVEQALQADPASRSGLSAVQNISEVLAPLASASILVDGNNTWGDKSGKYFNIGMASRFLKRLPPPGIYANSFSESPLQGGGGIRATKAQLRLLGEFKKTVPALVPGDLQDAVQIDDNNELLVFAITRQSYTISEGRFTLTPTV